MKILGYGLIAIGAWHLISVATGGNLGTAGRYDLLGMVDPLNGVQYGPYITGAAVVYLGYRLVK